MRCIDRRGLSKVAFGICQRKSAYRPGLICHRVSLAESDWADRLEESTGSYRYDRKRGARQLRRSQVPPCHYESSGPTACSGAVGSQPAVVNLCMTPLFYRNARTHCMMSRATRCASAMHVRYRIFVSHRLPLQKVTGHHRAQPPAQSGVTHIVGLHFAVVAMFMPAHAAPIFRSS